MISKPLNMRNSQRRPVVEGERIPIDLGFRDRVLPPIDPVFENLREGERFRQMMSDLKDILDKMRAQVEME